MSVSLGHGLCPAIIPVIASGSRPDMVPWFAPAILAARRSPPIGEILVVTEDPDSARIAHDYGARVVVAGGSLEALLRSGVDHLATRPERLVVLQAGQPPASAAQIASCVAALDHRADAASAVSLVAEHGRRWTLGADGLAQPAGGPALWRDNPAVLAVRTTAFLEQDSLAAEPVVGVPWLETTATAALVPPGLRALVMDFDGVLTDDAVHLDQNGVESVSCSRGDGLGIGLLQKAGFALLILSKEPNPVVSARGRKLKLEVRQGIDDKRPELEKWAAGEDLTLSDIAYMGNDINDLGCLAAVGWPVAPADAHPAVKRVAAHVTGAVGGRGAVREIAELLLGLA